MLKKMIKKFHLDQRGLETLQVVMIIAIAAIVAIAIFAIWNRVKPWADEKIDEVIDSYHIPQIQECLITPCLQFCGMA